MRIFDSHCHLDDEAFSRDREASIVRARQADVTGMMVVGLGVESSIQAIALAERYDGVVAAVGVHPHDAAGCNDHLLTTLAGLGARQQVKAWGEIGLDFNRMMSPQKDQERCFIKQLELADEFDLPLIFHERESGGRFLEILASHSRAGRQGVVHCFSGTDGELDAYLALGLYIGVTGILTINGRGRELRRQVKRIPLGRLLVETDAPYLTPTPQRNKFRRNEPAFVRTVLLKLADILDLDAGVLAEQTWLNACSLFGLSKL